VLSSGYVFVAADWLPVGLSKRVALWKPRLPYRIDDAMADPRAQWPQVEKVLKNP
jgi:hypothetical protein